MSKKRIRVDLSPDGMDRAIEALHEYEKWLKEKTILLLDKLADHGYFITSVGFSDAVYDGTNDVNVKIEDRGQTTKAIVAVGNATLFIEFGTGVMYPNNHPEAAENGMIRGEYGKGKGKQRSWGYYGDPGTNGIVLHGKKGPFVITHGNPANMPMYNAVKQLEADLKQYVKEVFV